MKWGRVTIGVLGVVLGAVATSLHMGGFELRWLHERVDALEQERAELMAYAERLAASRRMAQVDVLAQRKDERGRTVTTLRWQQISPQGVLETPQTVEIIGGTAYFEGLVIKFEQRHVGQGDTERGASLAMFRRLFGNLQEPEQGVPVDRTPPVVETDGGSEPALEDRLWQRFWELVADPELAKSYGVRVAQIEAPAVPVRPGQIWEIELDAAGGLNIKKVGQRPARRQAN